MTPPRATARLQFHKGFTLDAAIPLIPYLAALGISHIYSSPLLKARPGSTHCYDIVDHGQINPELGGEPALRRLVAALRTKNMGLIVDIVPNHMGVGGSDNAWWLDVLEWGRSSHYAEFFDIDWTPPDPALRNRLLVPFLADAYGEVLSKGELRLQCDRETGTFFVAYYEHVFPLCARSMARLLRTTHHFTDIANGFSQIARAGTRTAARAAAVAAKHHLALALSQPEGEGALAAILSHYDNSTKLGQAHLNALLEDQHYRLAWWRAAADEINWRRFFDINMLAGLRVERPSVFEATHRLILSLYAQNLIDGVRIDHIDGLADPRGYCRKLRRAMEAKSAAKPYILVEKILAPRERLPEDWRTDGTTGYDFMDQVSAVLHDPGGETPLTELWTRLTARPENFADEETAARRQILRDNLTSELHSTASHLSRIACRDLSTRDYTLTALRRALTEILIHFPTYRIYAGITGANEAELHVMDTALTAARRDFRAANRKLLDLVCNWVATEAPCKLPPGPRRRERLRAMIKFQQLSAPVAAKSVEDTAFYRYGRLLSRNEVGSNPGQFCATPQAFHAACTERQKRLPAAMLATATHDHKRGEDTRARLAVLSEIPEAWETALTRWMRLNAPLRRALDGGIAPSPADEIMLYQTLIAAWPLTLPAEDEEGLQNFTTRVAAWAEKSVREAKRRSEWAAPDQPYESALQDFLHATLDPNRPVLAEIIAFARRLNLPGAINGLSQTLLRLTTPGIPDLYQGTEFWDQSLVDPDNRRPVDFRSRITQLAQPTAPAALLPAWQTGAIKQALIARTLSLRTQHPALFAQGHYDRLEAEGPAAAHILAFSRTHSGTTIIAAVTRLSASLLQDATAPLVPAAQWRDTNLTLPNGAWEDCLNGGTIPHQNESLPAATLFARLPIALLRRLS